MMKVLLFTNKEDVTTDFIVLEFNHGKTKRATLQKRNVIFNSKNEM